MSLVHVPPGDLLCAVSGGADSTALLLMLHEHTMRSGEARLVAAHMNHSLRGEASDADEAFVRALCTRLGIPLCVRRTDTEAERRRRKLGLEDCARQLRYDFLEQQRRLWDCTYICTAHTADDNLETLLLMLTRGAGLRGLGGIPPLRGSVLRPLLSLSRAEVLAYLRSQGQDWREDETNRTADMRRNRFRQDVIPLLRAENPSLLRLVSRTLTGLRDDEDCLTALARREAEALAEKVPEGVLLPVEALLRLHPALRVRVFRLVAEHLGRTPTQRQYDALETFLRPGHSGARLELGGGAAVWRRQTALLFGSAPKTAAAPRFVEAPDGGPARICFRLRADSLRGALCLRFRQPGDRLRLAGRAGGKSLKKWMIEAGIPRERRDRLCVAADDEGIVAVEGLGVAERCTPHPGDAVFELRIAEVYE